MIAYRDRAGRTALHLAVLAGNLPLIELLIALRSDLRQRDCDGCSVVHLAARVGNTEVIELLNKCGAELTSRAPNTGWSPLHEAAYTGNFETTKKLLELGVPVHPRCMRGRTPAELARTRNHTDTMNLIEGWTKKLAMARPRQLSTRQFLHGPIDRNEATNLCQQAGPGGFLVRESRRRQGDLVLTANFNNHVFNYEVRNGDHLWFSIDDGPMFESIEMLVDYYLQNADGLPGILVRPIEPVDEATKGLKSLQIAQDMVPPNAHFQTNGAMMNGGGTFNGSTILPPVAHRGNLMMPHTDVPARRAQPSPPDMNSLSSPPPDPNEFKGAEAPHIPSESLEFQDPLGEGEFGSVMRGIWHPPGPNQPRPVAIKTLRQECLVNGEKEFVREAAVMAKLQHPSIVTLYGVCRERKSGMLMLIQELLHLGSALDYTLSHVQEVSVLSN